MSSESRTALVTGASRGLGRAIAERLARDGWRIALVARQASKLNEVRAVIEAAGGKACVHTADISDPQSADQVIAAVEKESGPLGALINNAGITKDGLLMRMDDADWSAVLDTNLTGAFRWIRAASRGMLKARAGRIVNIGSVVGLVGNAGQANYAAAKAGLIGLTQSVAREFASRGITCNCVCPGFFDTDMTSVLKEDLKSKVLTGIPLGRFGKPEEVAGLVSFLCGADAGYVTGQAWAIDGGMTM
ncbi:MAG: 3-oxoacyl-[acyl-carrier-protein] reductase [Verrucomicrobia bacterium]|nr:3-oxoacyl-[acyl-carrier-protein] reductase [Verrucomicrobiota bacterium]